MSWAKGLLLILVFVLMGFVAQANSQACEHLGSVEIRLQDENEKPVSGATIKFVDIPKGNALDGREFIENRKPWDQYIAIFCQSEIISKEKLKNGDHKQYDILVGAKGYQETKAKISIQHCIGSCLVNRAFVTIVSESAKLVTIKGLVKIYSAGYNEKGKIVSSEKIVAGAPVQFRRSTMVSFFTKSDIDGNYNITVPAGAYSVYATAAPGCYMCAEYFGNIVGDKDPTNLNITLRFYGEGNLKILKTSDQGELNKIINNEQFNIWNNQARCGSDGESGEDCFAYFGRWVQDSRDEIDTSDAEAG